MKLDGRRAARDRRDSMQHERCVLQLLRRHFARYTPELVARDLRLLAARTSSRSPRRCARTPAASAPRRSCYAVGWTQHTVGVQNIRAASIIQLLLGQHRPPGGGILALRGHANIQGSTDIPTLYNILPGLHPDAAPAVAPDARQVRRAERSRHRRLGQPAAVHRVAAEGVVGRRRHRGERLLLRLPAAHQRRPLALRDDAEDARRRACRGMFCVGPEPGRRLGQLEADAPGAGQARLARRPRLPADRDGDLLEGLARARGGRGPRPGHRDRGVLPAGRRAHREGRHLHQHPAAAAVAPQGVRAARRLPLGAALDLPPRQARSARSSPARRPEGPADPRPDVGLPARRARTTSPTPSTSCRRSPAATPTARSWPATTSSKDDGSTTCGSWIHCGIYKDGVNQTARRKPHTEQNWIAPEWGWAWPKDTRILYNRASADPDGQAVVGAQALRLVGRRARAGGPASATRRTSRPTKAPGLRAAGRTPRGWRRSRATSRSSCTPTGAAGCTRRPGSSTDRCRPTTSRRSRRSRTRSTPSSRTRPARSSTGPRTRTTRRRRAGRRGVPVRAHDLPADRAPHRRRHVAHGARTWPSCSPSSSARSRPQLAAERGLEHGGWATIVTARAGGRGAGAGHRRGSSRCGSQGRTMHQVGAPYHWGGVGIVTGDSANELLPLVLDNNVHISEYKVAHVRHPAGPAPARPGAARAGRGVPPPGGGEGAMKLETHCVARDATASSAKPADGLLHRHVGVHRLQGVRGGVQGVEPDPDRSDHSAASPATPTTTRSTSAPTPGATSPSSSRSCRPTPRDGASLVERGRAAAAIDAGVADLPGGRRHPLADGLRRVQALHRRRLPRGLPDRRAVPHRVRDRRRPAGHLQRLRLLRARRARSACSTSARTTAGCGSARSATTASRTTWSRPARRRARRTRSSSASSPSCASAPSTGSPTLQQAGPGRGPAVPGRRATTASAAPARSSCCSTSPRSTGCRPTRSTRARDLGSIWAAAGARRWRSAVGLAAAVFGGAAE